MFVERANASPKRSSAPEGFTLHRTWYYHYKKPRCSSSVRDFQYATRTPGGVSHCVAPVAEWTKYGVPSSV